MDNWNYPMGSDTPSAPWNEVPAPELDFTVTAEYVLKARDVEITTDEAECHLDGYYRVDQPVFEHEVGSPVDMMEQACKYLEEYAKQLEKGESHDKWKARDIRVLINDMGLWEVEDCDIESSKETDERD